MHDNIMSQPEPADDGKPPKPGNSSEPEAKAEEMFILRVPTSLAPGLESYAKGDSELTLQYMRREKDKFVFWAAGDIFSATMVHLPCIVETHKTLDNSAYFKSGEISQMLIVHPKGEPKAKTSSRGKGKRNVGGKGVMRRHSAGPGAGAGAGLGSTPADRDADLDMPEGALPRDGKLTSGLTPPTKHIVQRRFNKVNKNKTKFSPDQVAAVQEQLEYLNTQGTDAPLRTEYEELVAFEDYMESWPDSMVVTRVNGRVTNTEFPPNFKVTPNARRELHSAVYRGGFGAAEEGAAGGTVHHRDLDRAEPGPLDLGPGLGSGGDEDEGFWVLRDAEVDGDAIGEGAGAGTGAGAGAGPDAAGVGDRDGDAGDGTGVGMGGDVDEFELDFSRLGFEKLGEDPVVNAGGSLDLGFGGVAGMGMDVPEGVMGIGADGGDGDSDGAGMGMGAGAGMGIGAGMHAYYYAGAGAGADAMPVPGDPAAADTAAGVPAPGPAGAPGLEGELW